VLFRSASPGSGWIAELDALKIGELARSLGAGRLKADDEIDPQVGVECLKKVGERVEVGDSLALIRARSDVDTAAIATQYQQAVRIARQPVPPAAVVLDSVGV
jgi:pyrimidine-nucleoside phosphorylase